MATQADLPILGSKLIGWMPPNGQRAWLLLSGFSFGWGTKIVDHRRIYENRTCKLVQDDVDEKCVNRKLALGRNLRGWLPLVNDCHSFVNDVLKACRNGRPEIPSLPRWWQRGE
jgi:hypothetical protein